MITERFTKLVKTIRLTGISAVEAAEEFVHTWGFNYRPQSDLIADNGNKFRSKFFLYICRIIRVHNPLTTTYHNQTNGQVELFNITILTALKAYISDHRRVWDLYTDAFTYSTTVIHIL